MARSFARRSISTWFSTSRRKKHVPGRSRMWSTTGHWLRISHKSSGAADGRPEHKADGEPGHEALKAVVNQSSARQRLDGRFARLAGANADHIRQIGDKNLAVADLAGLGRAEDRV